MAKKRNKKRARKRKRGSGSSSSGGGGAMQSIRSGFRRAAGVEKSKSGSSTVANVIWTLILLAAIALLLYRWYG